MPSKTLSIAILLVAPFFCPLTSASASLLVPDSIVGQGSYNKSEQLLIDGTFSAEFGVWTGPTTVHWSGQTGSTGVAFTIDYGSLKNIDDVRISVDNNDVYRVEYSTDNVNYSTLFDIAIADGEVNFGMDTMHSLSTDPEYVANIDFASVQAQYLRVFALGGDNAYAISEIEAYGSDVSFGAVPEPATVTIWSLIGVCGLAVAARRRKQSA